jgi:hypothetical protein
MQDCVPAGASALAAVTLTVPVAVIFSRIPAWMVTPVSAHARVAETTNPGVCVQP